MQVLIIHLIQITSQTSIILFKKQIQSFKIDTRQLKVWIVFWVIWENTEKLLARPRRE